MGGEGGVEAVGAGEGVPLATGEATYFISFDLGESKATFKRR